MPPTGNWPLCCGSRNSSSPRGWATAKKGLLIQNLEMTNRGLEMLRAALNTNLRLEAEFGIAEFALIAGDPKAVLVAVQAMESLGPMGDGLGAFYVQFFKAHLVAISGDEADTHEAEALFHSCLDHARERRWKIPELHTATGLARLMARTGRRDEAREILADTYNWFTEGFDTMPLRDAKALLDELNG